MCHLKKWAQMYINQIISIQETSLYPQVFKQFITQALSLMVNMLDMATITHKRHAKTSKGSPSTPSQKRNELEKMHDS